jgi:hypothetical protein
MEGNPSGYCYESSRAQVAETVEQFVFDCPAPTLAGDYRVNYAMSDQIGNFYLYEPLITVAPAP